MTALIDTTIKAKGFRNWLRGALAVLYAKQGLYDFVLDEFTQFQQDLLANNSTSPATVCGSCTTENVLFCPTQNFCTRGRRCNRHDPSLQDKKPNQSCPNQICRDIRDGIHREHRYNGPSWKNTEATRWCTDAFELAKCYMAPDGYSGVTSLADTDFNGTVSVIINNKRFQNKMAADLSQQGNICTEARDVGRELRHSAHLNVTDKELKQYTDTLIDLLTDEDYLSADLKAREAVDKIKQLKMNTLTVATTDITTVLDQTLKDVVTRHRDSAVHSIATRKRKAEKDLEEKLQDVKASLTNIETIAIRSLDKIVATKTSALFEINTTAKKRKREISEIASKEKRLIKREIQTQKDILQQKTSTDQRQLEQCLKEDLVCYYRSELSTIPISPLVDEHDVPVQDFYVQPPLTCVDLQKTFGQLQEPKTKTPVRSYRSLFLRGDGELYKNIYITAKAGVGKTSFAKKVCMTWCQAQNHLQRLEKKFQTEDVDVMKRFEFLFMVCLRDTLSVCDLDSMVYNQVVSSLARHHRYSEFFLKDVLQGRICLVLLDGLDEWSHPINCRRGTQTEHEIPHRPARERCTVLTATRPWKLDVANLRASQIDRHVEINELDKTALEQLATNAVALLNERSVNCRPKSVQGFYSAASSLKLDSVRHIPYILLQMICLWFDEKSIGKSKCEIYSNILELTLSRGLRKSGKRHSSHVSKNQKCEDTTAIPPCLEANELCRSNYGVLLTLGKIAFETLFCLKKESSLVFDRMVFGDSMSEKTLAFCLDMGLLSQNKSHAHVSFTQSKFSFQHKSVQEYFAALYIQSYFDSQPVQKRIQQVCHSLATILEMSNVFVFLGGLNPDTCDELLQMLQNVITSDKITRRYRDGLLLSRYGIKKNSGYIDAVKSLQTMKTDIAQEIADNGQKDFTLHIDDIIIDSTTGKDSRLLFKTLVQNSKNDIKSVSIRQCQSTEEFTRVIEILGLQSVHSLHKLEIHAVPTIQDLYRLLSGSVKTLNCLNLSSGLLKNNLHHREYTKFSSEIVRTIVSMDQLQSLLLSVIRLSHNDINILFNYISERKKMSEIALENIKCTEHDDRCAGESLDLSQHQSLKTLRLSEISVSQFQINSSSLEYCSVGQLAEYVLSPLLDCLENATNLGILWFKRLSSGDVQEKMLKTLPKLVHLKNFSIQRTDLGDRQIVLPHRMTNIEYVDFFMVSMTSSALENLINSIDILPQPVEVVLEDCKVTPENRCQHIKDNIRRSSKYRILFDGLSTRQLDRFRFQTISNDLLKHA